MNKEQRKRALDIVLKTHHKNLMSMAIVLLEMIPEQRAEEFLCHEELLGDFYNSISDNIEKNGLAELNDILFRLENL